MDLLAKIKEICIANHINFTIVLLPYEFQLRSDNLANNQPQLLMAEELQKMNVTVLNPAANLVDIQDSKQLYLYGDGIHFSKKGHRYIFDFLKKHYNLLSE